MQPEYPKCQDFIEINNDKENGYYNTFKRTIGFKVSNFRAVRFK